MDESWLDRRRFLRPTIPSACEAYAVMVGAACCSSLGPNTALVPGFVNVFALVGQDKDTPSNI